MVEGDGVAGDCGTFRGSSRLRGPRPRLGNAVRLSATDGLGEGVALTSTASWEEGFGGS